MTRHCSCCSGSPSSAAGPPARFRSVAACLAIALSAAGVGTASADGGRVTGTVNVERATLRAEGPKHDLDVVLYLEPVDRGGIRPSADRAVMDQRGLVFLPHVLAIRRGTTVTFLNSDNDQHNVYFLDDRTGDTLDIGTWGPGVSVDHTFSEPGMVITLCKLHLEMAAYIVVIDAPWFVTARFDPETYRAEFAIEGVPPGEYELRAWHKKLKQAGPVERIRVDEGGAREAELVLTKAKYAGKAR